MSSIGERRANSGWRPRQPEPRQLPAAARRVLRWSQWLSLGYLLLICVTNMVLWSAHRSHTPWSNFLGLLAFVWLPLIAVNVAVTWWLMWRMAKAEAGGDSR